MPALTSVPTVDLSNLNTQEGKRLALDNIRRACTDWGVFYLSGTPVLPAVLNNATNETQAFFSRSTEKKMEIALENVPSSLGYVPLASERTGGKVDYRERIILRGDDPASGGWEKSDPLYMTLQGKNQWPSEMPNFRRAHEDLLASFTDVSRTVHMTFGGIIYQATDHECLQAQAPNGEWVICPPKPNTLVYVVGAICESITRGVFKACFHRVLTPAPESGSRYAIVAALHIDYDISLTNPEVMKALEIIGKNLQAGLEVNNGILEDFLNERFDAIGMRTLQRYMRSFPEVTAKWFPDYSGRAITA
ncbi:Clavaminate synthase-like protein [Penicillium verhagenii]|uniref:Clavaminate synthase-like protein n=1 Tax=Penicillium verhagenii TaxID=1562060 RepID=UPI0025459E0B|nr:Clavaminate synthase-like protein [Penicillium verhagenii]KAJ5935809.1 Clavaminate synthase-like protein [Penicillium verhagenii]